VLAAVRAVVATERFHTSLEEVLGLPSAASLGRAMASSEAP
jgi:hypothetical protein